MTPHEAESLPQLLRKLSFVEESQPRLGRIGRPLPSASTEAELR